MKKKRWVVKLGTGILTDASQHHDIPQMKNLVGQVAALVNKGRHEIILVSSSAVCGGMAVLGMKKRPTALPEIQACAAIGQSRLMTRYEDLFSKHGLHVAQVLLTYPDIDSRTRFRNAQNTLNRLLDHNIVPVINENDTVSVDEIRFGDNDKLSAYVATMVRADLLVILSGIDGLLTSLDKDGEVIPEVRKITPALRKLAGGTRSETSVGGMISKIDAAQIAVDHRIPVRIANGRTPRILQQIAEGKRVGTLFKA
ncbi:MAG: glutamate 5-kinase [Verrucomicrobiae bacterium]|nr:glutamate 5-kinase [Verrucomicrobiae bacterium]